MKLTDLLGLWESRTRCHVNVDAIHPAFYESESLGLEPDMYIHRSPFCSFAKRHGARRCFANKARSLALANKGRVFFGACPFGVWELAQPVLHCGELAAVVYFGGFKTPAWNAASDTLSYEGPPPPEPYAGFINAMKEGASFIAKFIVLELELWRARGGQSRKRRPQSFYRDFCLQFIERNYQEDIGIGDMASALKVTPNFLSYRIRSSCGRTFGTLLTERRIEAATRLLEFHEDLDIAEIAFRCGFRDANYFSSVFRRLKGVPPGEWRRREGVRTAGRRRGS